MAFVGVFFLLTKVHRQTYPRLKMLERQNNQRRHCLPHDRQPKREGAGFNSLTYPFTHNPPVHQSHPINTCTFASTMFPPSAPVTSGQTDSALSMPSAEWLAAFWAVAAKPPGKWSHSSQHGPTNHLSLSSYIPFSIRH